MPKTPMTNRGAELLREELHRLKAIERPANATAIGFAAAVFFAWACGTGSCFVTRVSCDCVSTAAAS